MFQGLYNVIYNPGVASVLDPFGNVLGLIENRHFKLPSSE
jgi:hypothetical protein